MKMKDLIPWRDKRPVEWVDDHPFTRIQRDMNRAFDNFWEEFEFPTRRNNGFDFTPSLDMKETDDALKITAELPGMVEEDVELTVANNILTIKGEKKQEHEEEKDNYYRMERHYGSFTRTIPLPTNLVDEEKIEATFNNGILTVTLPKRPEAVTETKKIPIQAG